MPSRARPLPAALALAALACAGCVYLPEAREKPAGEAPFDVADAAAPRLPLDFVPEMGPVPETRWKFCPPESFPDEVKSALADWEKRRGALEGKITPDLARSLSRWAKRQMAGYAKVPPLGSAVFAPVAESPDKKQILLEATLDTLPSHNPLVKRWLKIYLAYDRGTSSIARAVVTIRGQAEE